MHKNLVDDLVQNKVKKQSKDDATPPSNLNPFVQSKMSVQEAI